MPASFTTCMASLRIPTEICTRVKSKPEDGFKNLRSFTGAQRPKDTGQDCGPRYREGNQAYVPECPIVCRAIRGPVRRRKATRTAASSEDRSAAAWAAPRKQTETKSLRPT